MSPGMPVLAFAVGELEIARRAAEWIEIAAIIVISGSVLIAFGAALVALVRPQGGNQTDNVGDEVTGLSGRSPTGRAVRMFKRVVAGGLLVGLDLLIAADVIKTVTVDPTLENILSLGLLVLIRTFLSWSLILEVSGRWPWQRRPPSDTAA